jgi:hypothetical protein
MASPHREGAVRRGRRIFPESRPPGPELSASRSRRPMRSTALPPPRRGEPYTIRPKAPAGASSRCVIELDGPDAVPVRRVARDGVASGATSWTGRGLARASRSGGDPAHGYGQAMWHAGARAPAPPQPRRVAEVQVQPTKMKSDRPSGQAGSHATIRHPSRRRDLHPFADLASMIRVLAGARPGDPAGRVRPAARNGCKREGGWASLRIDRIPPRRHPAGSEPGG